ncbi:hypothetical protein CXB40_24210 [Pseudomonas syringae pv. avii]|uniref:Uncharacterized protein n=1 Tax=Pseudomonas syringae pv. tomato (strain ATCC BAA-871 / DC3000) TaxID=223283 RepID=Q886W2_PSESM|nr:protein of unknown function [Pseudomonas syringae pv. tomato str. DC3000]MBW8025026.1 hypothetical protein [Pseudomonas syringae pv. tomato]MCF5225758.1 hypothetical protein [Pseudomonas syringae]POQ01456.1 hypothetical protein CXB40_24210 [Pseudomonas syringae pv. avii]PYD06089.1 hypothetical protein DND90_22845 [Pseudomonas syringae pv. maculicola]
MNAVAILACRAAGRQPFVADELFCKGLGAPPLWCMMPDRQQIEISHAG